MNFYKNIRLALVLALSLGWMVSFHSCQMELPMYNQPDDALNFDVSRNGETGQPIDKLYSFVYVGDDVMQDTVWITLKTQGFLKDVDRPFRLHQLMADSLVNAVAGVHYTSFDSAEMLKYCVIPAGQNTVKVPIIVHRDASLDESDVRLNIEVMPNENFTQGVVEKNYYPIVISNLLTKPARWESYYFGTYGPVKHRFMIAQTGLRWDDEFVAQILDGDYGYVKYLTMFLYQRLQVVNAERKAQGLEELKEATGKKVAFDYGGSF